MNISLKEIPEIILEFLKQKNINLDQIQLQYYNEEEFDFDVYQQYYVFVLEPTNRSHRKLVIVRRTYTHHNDTETIEIEKRNLVQVH